MCFVRYSCLVEMFVLLAVVVAVVSGRDSSLFLLLQFVLQREEGGVEINAAVECVWARKPCLLHKS